jgi:hypothetical protein
MGAEGESYFSRSLHQAFTTERTMFRTSSLWSHVFRCGVAPPSLLSAASSVDCAGAPRGIGVRMAIPESYFFGLAAGLLPLSVR